MASLGMICLGAFIGWVTSYGLIKIQDWSKPGNVFSAVISAAVAGAVFTFIQFLGGDKIGNALFLYPFGLAYGAFANSFSWLSTQTKNQQAVHILAFAIASIIILALMFSP